MDRRAAWVLGIVFGGLFLCLFGFLLVLALAVRSGGQATARFGGGDRVGVVELTGEIKDDKDTKKLLADLKQFEDADQIKAIVVRINSPGGDVAASQEIHDALKRIRAKKKVIASMGSLAASGGYYVAVAADEIFANPGTLTGSIGVIMQLPNVEGLLHWAGISMNVITAGKMKDSGSPFRAMSADERTYFEKMLEDVHEQFIAAVAEGRGLKPEDVRPIADGRVLTGRQAKGLKLVDALGGIEEAVARAGKLAGIKGTPRVEYPEKQRKLVDELFGEEASTLVGGAVHLLEHAESPGLQYRLPTAVP